MKAGGQFLCANFLGVGQNGPKFNGGVALHTRIRRLIALVSSAKIADNFFLKFIPDVNYINRYSQLLADFKDMVFFTGCRNPGIG